MSNLFKKIKFILVSIILIFIVISIVSYADLFSHKNSNTLPSSSKVKETITDNKEPSRSSDKFTNNESSSNTTNILVLDSKSDSMVVASVDDTNKNIELTPFTNTGYFDRSNMDNLLNNMEKITDMNLDKFIQIDTSKLMDVISVLGDVSVNIKSEDIELINNLIPIYYGECNNSAKGHMKLIHNPGVQSLNEYQTMAYVHVITKDSNKQEEAILSLSKNMKNLGFDKYFEIYNKIKPYVETNLTLPDILQLASTEYKLK